MLGEAGEGRPQHFHWLGAAGSCKGRGGRSIAIGSELLARVRGGEAAALPLDSSELAQGASSPSPTPGKMVLGWVAVPVSSSIPKPCQTITMEGGSGVDGGTSVTSRTPLRSAECPG